VLGCEYETEIASRTFLTYLAKLQLTELYFVLQILEPLKFFFARMK
jgi:hypothetical protein